jgi:hypothetical protein
MKNALFMLFPETSIRWVHKRTIVPISNAHPNSLQKFGSHTGYDKPRFPAKFPLDRTPPPKVPSVYPRKCMKTYKIK